MTRIDIISGFLGAGKTTLIKKLLGDALKGQQVVLIENEFGEIGIDGGFLKDAGIEIREMNSGCICCSLVGDFGAALKDVITKYHPDRIIIEPSGVGKLSDVIKAVDGVEKEAGVALNSATTVVDVMKCKMYLRNFGEFFENQVKSAGTIILSRTDKADTAKVEAAVKMLRELNPEAHIITTPVEVLGGKKVLDTMEGAIINLEQVEEEEHHHHHHDHGEECTCGSRGCFEAYSSATALIRDTKRTMAAHPESLLHAIAAEQGGVDGRTAFLAKERGDEAGAQVVEDYIEHLTCGLTNLVNIFFPEVLALSGGVANQGDALLLPLRERVRERSFGSRYAVSHTRIELCTLGYRAGVIGAAMLARE